VGSANTVLVICSSQPSEYSSVPLSALSISISLSRYFPQPPIKRKTAQFSRSIFYFSMSICHTLKAFLLLGVLVHRAIATFKTSSCTECIQMMLKTCKFWSRLNTFLSEVPKEKICEWRIIPIWPSPYIYVVEMNEKIILACKKFQE
jgi:hypothetical protein